MRYFKIYVLLSVVLTFPFSSFSAIKAKSIESCIGAGFYPTSSKVEHHHRQQWSSFFLSLYDLKLKFGEISQSQYDSAHKIYLNIITLNNSFVENLEYYEEQGGSIYLLDPSPDSDLSGYEHIYVLLLNGKWYAFKEEDSRQQVLKHENLSYYPVKKFYECIDAIGALNEPKGAAQRHR